ncbi:hypothetical protein GCM10009117_12460 [Gangjinia marincola]|uniref:Letm1 RBD domain-containing protein n=1 Tax=Gangjinia marincola TaxID=578463 RepID=A0ABP3XUQ6_9FLAO
MNPSATGWIAKHLPFFLEHTAAELESDEQLYHKLRKNGFIYGNSISTLFDDESLNLTWTAEEKAKINLFDALVYTYYDSIDNANPTNCINSIIEFYKVLDRSKSTSFFRLPSITSKPSEVLEKILDQRIQTNESILQKNFSHLVTNALLYLDVLVFDEYLMQEDDPRVFAEHLEAIIVNTVFLALDQKQEKHAYDVLLIHLIKSSLRYHKIETDSTITAKNLDLTVIDHLLIQRYVVDMACLAVYNNKELDRKEHAYILKLGEQIQLGSHEVTSAINSMQNFIDEHLEQISYFKYSNPVKHFYTSMSRTVSTLILRNKNRVMAELNESKDLVYLLAQSSVRDLNDKEKKQIKDQLLDLCKTIPSFAIFVLPGGGVLLPLLVKFIPQLLPSAFNENKVD